jgi:hypothetical protein
VTVTREFLERLSNGRGEQLLKAVQPVLASLLGRSHNWQSRYLHSRHIRTTSENGHRYLIACVCDQAREGMMWLLYLVAQTKSQPIPALLTDSELASKVLSLASAVVYKDEGTRQVHHSTHARTLARRGRVT